MKEAENNSETGVFFFLSPVKIMFHLWNHRNLIRQFTWREVVSRYKGSYMGMGWSVVQPLLMLFIYTFVFSVIFKARWGADPNESRLAFGLALFIGLITFGIFSEVANTSPFIVLSHSNLVKKIVFPLEILPLVRLLSTLVNAIFSLAVLFIGVLAVYHHIHLTIILLPLVWIPMCLFSLGCGYFLSSLGVFIRDIGATINVITTMFLFLTPIFYPLDAVPERFRVFCLLNPIAIYVEDARRVVLWGITPNWSLFFAGLIFSIIVFLAGFAWFMKTKKAFADVL